MLARVEVVYWMFRPHFCGLLVPGVAGYYAATSSVGTGRLVMLIVFLALMGGVVNIINDLLDHEKDAVTAPHLPIPSGLISVAQARVAGALVVGLALVALALASITPGRWLAVVAITVVGLSLAAVYSLVKHLGAMGPLVAGVGFLSPVLGGWVIAGGGGTAVLGVLAYVFVDLLAGNIHASLIDVDSDPLVGTRTLSVRLGAVRAFLVSVGLAVVTSTIVVVLALVEGRPWVVALVVVGAGGAALSVPALARAFAEPGRGRWQRHLDFRPYRSWLYLLDVALLAAFSPLAGLFVGGGIWLFYKLQDRGYRARIVNGGLKNRLRPLAASLPAPGG